MINQNCDILDFIHELCCRKTSLKDLIDGNETQNNRISRDVIVQN